MAASVLLGITIGLLLAHRAPSHFIESAQGGWVAASALDRALTQELSGGPSDASPVRIALSFINHAGEYCRAFHIGQEASEGLACRRAGRWEIEMLNAVPPAAAGDAYRTAGSALSPALLNAIEARRVGGPLDPDAEKLARAQRWQPRAHRMP